MFLSILESTGRKEVSRSSKSILEGPRFGTKRSPRGGWL
ncbi:UNVERIFIED_ORG: hypothetical protein ABID75_005498 [Bacillus proteolyticus]